MNKYYFTSESVTEGHPDKLCDYISDTILDECLKQDPNSRVAVETFAFKNIITVAGQLTTTAKINIEELVRQVVKEIGYDNEKTDMDYKTCKVNIEINKQSPDIAMGVDIGGAGDQGIMFGYACLETENLMPYAIDVAHKLAQRLTKVRKEGTIPYLKSDGKVQVTVEYINDFPLRIDTILVSTQHQENITIEELENDIIEKVIKPTVDEDMIDYQTKFLINPTGKFVIGGAVADTGLTGRKIIVDTYGGYAHHGGGAFSGKDATKVDRSVAYMLRHIAKNIVANGLTRKCEIQASYGIGIAEPLSLYIDCFGTNKLPECDIIKIIKETFDLTPNGIIKYLDLKKPIYARTTNYGHFGREEFSWEELRQI